MATKHTGRRSGALIERLLELRSWGESPFLLVDVGCRGGVERRWNVFGDRLRAVGFDPYLAEIDRLNAANTREGIVYEAAFVTCRNYDRLFPRALRTDAIAARTDQPFERSSAAAALRRLGTSYDERVLGSRPALAVTERTIALDEYFDAEHRPHVDFVKIDTDGADIEVVAGAEATMASGGILGLTVEVQFQGAAHDYANTFSNIDRILRRRGFTLFDLQSQRYSRAELPAPFVTDGCGPTVSGQLLCGEAVYFRDLGDTDYERKWPYEVTRERVIKLACLFDLFDLPDCAAELLIKRGAGLDPYLRDELLDLLVSGESGSYAAHAGAFVTDYTQFYPGRLHQDAASPSPIQSYESAAVRRLQQRLARQVERTAKLRTRLDARDRRVAQLTARIGELKAKRHKRATSS